MQLHRVQGKDDWLRVAGQDRNGWQRLALRTHGVVTPGNIITLIGAILIGWALVAISDRQYWLALLFFLVGRLCDLFDGLLADKTDTKGKLGELLDATVDKIAVIFSVVTLIAFGVTPWWVPTVLLAVQLLITWQAANNYFRTENQHPARSGKLSMLFLWVSLGAFLLAAAMPQAHALIITVGYLTAVLSVILGLQAFWSYVRLSRQR